MAGLFSYPKRKLRKMVSDGDYPEALEFGKSIEEKFAKDPDFLFIMGSIYYILEDAKNSLSYLDRVLEINDTDSEALLLEANIHLYLKNYDTVRECCEKILCVDPDHKGAKDILKNLDSLDSV